MKGVAKQTLAIIEAGGYESPGGRAVEIGDAVREAVAGTRLYTPEQLTTLLDRGRASGGGAPPVEVTGEKTQAAAQRLAGDEGVVDLVLLNFASARNPGGGFLNGAKAQEEDVTRCSALYPCLMTQQT